MSTSTITKLMMASATMATLVSYANAAAPTTPLSSVATADKDITETVVDDIATPPLLTPVALPFSVPNSNDKLEQCMFLTQDKTERVGNTRTTNKPQQMNECIPNSEQLDRNGAEYMIAKCSDTNQVTFSHFKDVKCDNLVGQTHTFTNGAKIYGGGALTWVTGLGKYTEVYVNCEENCKADELPPTAVVNMPEDKSEDKTPPKTPNGETTSEAQPTHSNDAPPTPMGEPTPTDAEQNPVGETPKPKPDTQSQNDDNSGGNSKSAMGVLFAGLIVFLGMNA